MTRNILNWIVIFALGLSVACKKTSEVTSPERAASGLIDACRLISKEKIESIQGSPLTETKSTQRSGKGFVVSDCYYATKDLVKSVSVTVTQADPKASPKGNVKEYWEKTFGEEGKEPNESESEKEEGEKHVAPKKIEGLGDKAFWSGTGLNRALYVLKGDRFVCITIGSSADTNANIQRLKALAAEAVHGF